MLIIRKEQNEALAEYVRKRYEDRLIAHAAEFWPEESAALGDDAALRAAIRGRIARARRHGFSSERDVARFVDLTFALGDDFDTGPRWPWAGEILRQRETDPTARMERLCARAEQELARLEGLPTQGS